MHQAVRERPEEDVREQVAKEAAKNKAHEPNVEVCLEVEAELEHEQRERRDHVQGDHQRKAREALEPHDAGNAARDDAHGRATKVHELLVVLHAFHREELDVLVHFLHRRHACDARCLCRGTGGNTPFMEVGGLLLKERRYIRATIVSAYLVRWVKYDLKFKFQTSKVRIPSHFKSGECHERTSRTASHLPSYPSVRTAFTGVWAERENLRACVCVVVVWILRRLRGGGATCGYYKKMTLGPGSKRSKVAPRRHWSSIHGLIVHSRQLNRMLRTGDEGEQTLMARSSQSRRLSLSRMAAPTAGTAPAKPLVFRKTKREIQREREQQLALQRQQEKEADEQKQQERRNGCAKHELDQLQLLAACKSAIRLTCRSQYLQRRARTGLGLERRCPPRRRLLF